MGAFVAFGKFQNYRDFLLEKTAESTEENPAVGLWAKPYMTSEKYEFLGTLLTRKSFQLVAQGKQPPMQRRDISDSKTEHEDKVVQKLDAVLRSAFAQQFAGKLSDARAICKRDWAHFKDSSGEMPAHLRWLPHELAAAMRRDGARTLSVTSMNSLKSEQSQ